MKKFNKFLDKHAKWLHLINLMVGVYFLGCGWDNLIWAGKFLVVLIPLYLLYVILYLKTSKGLPVWK